MALWRVEQAADYLGIRPKTLYEWVRTGRIPHRKLGFNVRFEPAELEKWVQEQGGSGKEAAAAGPPPPGQEELEALAREAARRLRRLETEVGTQLSFPQRQSIKELAERLEQAAGTSASS